MEDFYWLKYILGFLTTALGILGLLGDFKKERKSKTGEVKKRLTRWGWFNIGILLIVAIIGSLVSGAEDRENRKKEAEALLNQELIDSLQLSRHIENQAALQENLKRVQSLLITLEDYKVSDSVISNLTISNQQSLSESLKRSINYIQSIEQLSKSFFDSLEIKVGTLTNELATAQKGVNDFYSTYVNSSIEFDKIHISCELTINYDSLFYNTQGKENLKRENQSGKTPRYSGYRLSDYESYLTAGTLSPLGDWMNAYEIDPQAEKDMTAIIDTWQKKRNTKRWNYGNYLGYVMGELLSKIHTFSEWGIVVIMNNEERNLLADYVALEQKRLSSLEHVNQSSDFYLSDHASGFYVRDVLFFNESLTLKMDVFLDAKAGKRFDMSEIDNIQLYFMTRNMLSISKIDGVMSFNNSSSAEIGFLGEGSKAFEIRMKSH